MHALRWKLVANCYGCSVTGRTCSQVQLQQHTPAQASSAWPTTTTRCRLQQLRGRVSRSRVVARGLTAEDFEELEAEDVVELVMDEMKEDMEKAVEAFGNNMETVRTGRANPKMLQRVMVDYYGVKTQLLSLASITAPSADSLVVSPFDKGSIDAISNAILNADLGVSASVQGDIVRVKVPELTAERRQQLVRQVKTMSEDFKSRIRAVRKDARQLLAKAEQVQKLEDYKREVDEQVQKETDKQLEAITSLLAAKEEDLTSV